MLKGRKQVSEQATIKRVNRALARDGEQLRRSRSTGKFWIEDLDRGTIVAEDVNLDGVARELGVLGEEEEVAHV